MGRWLLLLYLPLLLPLVVLTFFTWPWKVIGHAFRGFFMSVRSAWRGYSRSRHSHRRRPFSLWRNMFLGCWMELARQNESRHGPSLSANPGVELAPAYLETLLDATKETQARICSNLRTSVVTHSIFTAFLLLVLVQPVHTIASNGNNSVAVDLCGLFGGLAFIISLAVVGVYAQLASLLSVASTPEQFYWFLCSWERAAAGGQLATASVVTLALAAGLAAAFELFADWVFIVLLFTAATLLYGYLYFWADSMWCPYNGAYVHYSQSFYRELLGRETLQAHPSCCAFWELEPVLPLEAPGSLYDCMDRYLWRESQVSWYVGRGSSSGAAHGGHEMGLHPTSTDIYKLQGGGGVGVGAGSAGRSHSGRSSPAPAQQQQAAVSMSAVPPAAAAAAGAGAGMGVGMGVSSSSGNGGGASTAPAAGAGAGGSGGSSAGKTATDPALYSSWPSLMRYTSSSGSSKLQGRGKRGGSGTGLSAVSEGDRARPGGGAGGMPV